MATKITGQFFGQVFGCLGIVDAGHVGQQDVLRSEDMGVQRRGHRRVDASGNADYHPVHADEAQKGFQAIVQGVVDGVHAAVVRHLDGRQVPASGRQVEVDDFQGRLEGRAVGDDLAAVVVHGTEAVKSVDGFAVVLQADIVDIDERNAGLLGLLGKDPVAFVVFRQGEGRTGDIDYKVQGPVVA